MSQPFAGELLGAQSELLSQPLYDFQYLKPPGLATFFDIPEGQNGKTQADTNLRLAGELPSGQAFAIASVGLRAPLKGIEGASLTLVIGSRQYLTLPGLLCHLQHPGDRGHVVDRPLIVRSGLRFSVYVSWRHESPERILLGVVLNGDLMRSR